MGKTTGYSYIPQPFGIDPLTSKLTEIYRPMISIRISKDHGPISLPFDALIDSGSDRNLFPLRFATSVGVQFKKMNYSAVNCGVSLRVNSFRTTHPRSRAARYSGSKIKPKQIIGIGKVVIDAYTSEINIWIGTNRYQTEIDFSPQQQTPLLGRFGFFNLFKSVRFDEKGQFVYLEKY